jgi:23S rRNA (cytidine2498-2'-O)-methyltransferase
MRHPGVQFQQGDAFKFAPKQPVDWLVCDVIAAPERSIDLVLEWARRRWARQFVVTIKFKGTEDYPQLDRLIGALPEVSDDWRLTRLCANKNEACALGTVRAAPSLG